VDYLSLTTKLLGSFRTVEELRAFSSSTTRLSTLDSNVRVANSPDQACVVVSDKCPLLSVLKFFAEGRIHRVFVQKCTSSDPLAAADEMENFSPYAICSALDVIKFLAQKLSASDPRESPELQQFASTPILSLIQNRSSAPCTPKGTVFVESFAAFADRTVGSVALIDPETKRICGALSLSDLMFLNQSNLAQFLLMKVDEYLQANNASALVPSSVSENCTVSEAIFRLASKDLHCLFVTNDNLASSFNSTTAIYVRDIIRIALVS